MATLDQARGAIHTLLAAELTTVRYAPEHPTETLPAYPAMVVYTEGGSWEIEVGGQSMLGLARVMVEIHVSRGKSLHRSIDELQPFMDSVPNALIAALAAGTYAQRFTFGVIDFEVLASNWGGIDTMMARLERKRVV